MKEGDKVRITKIQGYPNIAATVLPRDLLPVLDHGMANSLAFWGLDIDHVVKVDTTFIDGWARVRVDEEHTIDIPQVCLEVVEEQA